MYKSPHHVFWCGYGNLFGGLGLNVGENLFPEVTVSMLQANSTASADDLLLYPCGGLCPTGFDHFPGKILTFNGESSPEKCRLPGLRTNNVSSVSPIDPTGSISAYAVSMHLESLTMELQNSIYRAESRNINTKERFLIYAASNCVPFREVSFIELSQIGPAEYAGRCNGTIFKQFRSPAIVAVLAAGTIVRAPKEGNIGWGNNHIFMHKYRFALVMENAKTVGYLTEKILNAFLAGCIPIYYGTDEVFDVFNRKSFIYYDINDPAPSLERIAFLESNRTAYDEMLKEPILANGTQTIEEYFSWTDEVGGGQLKWRIRWLLGYD
jgi:hypothetical protein